MKVGAFNKDILIILVAGSIAAAINLFRLPLFFEAEFVFGPFVVLLVAIFRGPIAGVLTSTIASIPLVLAWGSFWPTLTFGLEALFVALIYMRWRINVILLVICYWLFIGMPVSWFSISQYELFLDSHRTSILIKQLTNAILYAHVTALIMYLPAVKNFFGKAIHRRAMSIKEQSSHIISSLLITVGILFFFYNLNQNINNFNEKFNQTHLTKHEKFASNIKLIINDNLKSMNEYKYALSEVWDDDALRGKMILEFNQRYPTFKTMILSDKNGDLIHSSPPELVANVITQGEIMNISDRDYYRNAINSQQAYVSPGFIGRGFGNDLIVAISVGIPDSQNQMENLGVFEGSIYLNTMKMMKELIGSIDPTIDTLVIDQNNKLLFKSDALNLDILNELAFKKGVDTFYKHDLVNIFTDGSQYGNEVYYIERTKLDWGWTVVTLQNESIFADIIENTLISFAISIVLVVLIAKLLAWLISHSWSYYMQRLNNLIEQGADFSDDLAEFEANDNLPAEVSNLYQEIKRSRLKIVNMNQELQNTVAERTEKLRSVNAKLNIMAREDALTKLDNRHVFNESLNQLWTECQKELLSLSMLIIDIDHFKNINDTYGHPVGDDVLIQIAKELERFKNNRINCLSRIGGEEFCILMKGSELPQAEILAEKIRHHIEGLEFLVGVDKNLKVTVSVGVACIDPTKFTSSKLYQLTDNALYEAKQSGRNKIKSKELN